MFNRKCKAVALVCDSHVGLLHAKKQRLLTQCLNMVDASLKRTLQSRDTIHLTSLLRSYSVVLTESCQY